MIQLRYMILFQICEVVWMPVDSYKLESWLKIFKPPVMFRGTENSSRISFL